MIHLVIVEITTVITMACLKYGSVFIILVKTAYENSECQAGSSIKCQDEGGDLGALAVTSGHSHETFTLCCIFGRLTLHKHSQNRHTFHPQTNTENSQPRSLSSRTYDPHSGHQTCEAFHHQRSFWPVWSHSHTSTHMWSADHKLYAHKPVYFLIFVNPRSSMLILLRLSGFGGSGTQSRWHEQKMGISETAHL